jgi:hypothetical protein
MATKMTRKDNALWPEAAAIAQAHTAELATAARRLENGWEACTPEDHALRSRLLSAAGEHRW